MADNAAHRGGRGPPPPVAQPPNILIRRIAAVALGIFLYIAANPFTPVSWLTQPDWTTYLDGPRLVDRVLSPVLLMGAAILHWYIASAQQPLALTITVPNPGGEVRLNHNNGQPQMAQTDIVLGMWQPSYFWPAMALEAAVLWGMMDYGSFVVNELVRRCTLVGIILSVWVVGWNAMPWYRKEQAWGFIKDYVVRLILMEMVDMAFGGGRRRGGRRRRM